MENPAWSLIWHWPPMAAALKECKLDHEAVAHRCVWDRAKDGQRLKKVYKFCSTGKWIGKTNRKCNCKSNKHANLTITAIDKFGKKSFAGIGSALQRSAAYPRALGKLIVDSWKHNVQCPDAPESNRPSSSSSRHLVLQEMLGTSRSDACAWLEPTAGENRSWKAVQRPGTNVEAKQTAAWLQPSAGNEFIHHQAPSNKRRRALGATEITLSGWLQPSASGQQ